ncbi:MAG: hypothetical protein AB7T10_06380 [bacterium]
MRLILKNIKESINHKNTKLHLKFMEVLQMFKQLNNKHNLSKSRVLTGEPLSIIDGDASLYDADVYFTYITRK